jgi:Zn-finger nucleic acid-binding protein
MNCPICKAGFKKIERQGIEIDYCPQCRGVWLDRGELDRIIERSVLERRLAASGQRDEDPGKGHLAEEKAPKNHPPRIRKFILGLFG